MCYLRKKKRGTLKRKKMKGTLSQPCPAANVKTTHFYHALILAVPITPVMANTRKIGWGIK